MTDDANIRVIPAKEAAEAARLARAEFLQRLHPYGLTVLEDVQKKWWKT